MKTKKFTSLQDLHERASTGEEMAQKVCIGTLTNLGCEHLADDSPYGMTRPKWKRFYHGLLSWLDSMVGEYGHSESRAEKDLLAEVNNARSYSEDIEL